MGAAIWVVAGITALSGGVVAARMYETHRHQVAMPAPSSQAGVS